MLLNSEALKVGLIILCRYNSSRLPGKILLPINGKEVLLYIYERLQCSKYVANIVLATSTETDDDPIYNFCVKNKINCFRGSKENVAQRFLDCAIDNNFDYAVRVNGDNILADYQLIDWVTDNTIQNKCVFGSNAKDRTFPEGISVEVVKTDFYKAIISKFDTPRYFEHVMPYFYEHDLPNRYFYYRDKKEKLPKLALDSIDDFKFISAIIEQMDQPHTTYLLEDILRLANTIKD